MIAKGPWTLTWGDNIITDVEEIDVEHEVSSDDFETIQGRTIEIDGPFKASAIVTLLVADIPALAAILPQYFVANGGVLSTGETVNNADGAIDIQPNNCDAAVVTNNLDIASCGNPGQVARIVSARTQIEGLDVDNKIAKVMVKFIGEAEATEATLQFFREGTISVVS